VNNRTLLTIDRNIDESAGYPSATQTRGVDGLPKSLSMAPRLAKHINVQATSLSGSDRNRVSFTGSAIVRDDAAGPTAHGDDSVELARDPNS
jgi:hypothetical protein